MRIDPMTEDPRELEERAAEATRHEDERTLCDRLKENVYVGGLVCSMAFHDDTYAKPDTQASAVKDFAADYGWPAVFRVLAQAIHEHEQFIDRR